MGLVILDNIFGKSGGENCQSLAINRVRFETRESGDKCNSFVSHGKSGGGEAVGFINVGADDGETNDLCYW